MVTSGRLESLLSESLELPDVIWHRLRSETNYELRVAAANDYVSKIGSKIVLIDGSRLAELMIEFGVAVATDATYTVKRIDNDFFESI
jgi:restriction endonuclease Mrr